MNAYSFTFPMAAGASWHTVQVNPFIGEFLCMPWPTGPWQLPQVPALMITPALFVIGGLIMVGS